MQTGEVQRKKPDFIRDQGPKSARAERPRGSRWFPTSGNKTGMGGWGVVGRAGEGSS